MATTSLAKVKRFVRGREGERYWVGIDVHKVTNHLAIRREDGSSETWTCPGHPEVVLRQMDSLGVSVAAVAYEAGPTGFGLARTLREGGYRVLVVAPSKTPRAVSRGAKTDRLDCLKLAEYLQKDMLNSVTIPSQEEEAKRGVLRRRNQLTESIRRSKQRIKSLLLYHGVQEPKGLKNWSKTAVKLLHAMPLPDASLRHILDSHLLELEHLESMRAVVRMHLREIIRNNEKDRQAVEYMRTVHGVGEELATEFRLELFQPERFSKGEQVASYLGLAPVISHSGSGKPHASLKPSGKRKLRALAVEASWLWIAKDDWARSIYRRLLANTGTAQKAIVGVARHLAIVLWRLCLENRPYRPGTISA